MDVDTDVKFCSTISGTHWCTHSLADGNSSRDLCRRWFKCAHKALPTACCRKAIYWPSGKVSSSKVNLRPCLMRSLSRSPSLFPVCLALFQAKRNSFTLQIQIYEQSGKMYSYHRWSYYRRDKLSNENIIHCKWHLNTYQQWKKVISSA